jgi:hypothetical protein
MLAQTYALNFNRAANEINRLRSVHSAGSGDDVGTKFEDTTENLHALRCGMCPTSASCSPIKNICLNCNDGTALCENCLGSVHSRLPAFRAHKVVPIEDDPSILCRLTSKKMKKSEICSLHKCNVRNIFCNTCSFPICSQCVSDGTHSGHKLSSMEATVQKQRDDLRETLGHLQALATRIELSTSTVRKRIDTLKSSAGFVSNTLLERHRNLQLAMEAKKAKAEKDMELHSQVTSKEFEGHLDVLDIKTAGCRRSIAVSGRLTISKDFKCHLDAYNLFKELRAPLERIRDQSALVRVEEKKFSFIRSHQKVEAFVTKIATALAVSIDYDRVDLRRSSIYSQNPYATLVVQPSDKYPEGLLIATNYTYNEVLVLNAQSKEVLETINGVNPIGLAMLPASEEFPDGLLYISENNGNRVHVINMSSWKEYNVIEQSFNKPWGLAVVPPCEQHKNGMLIVADYMNHCIKFFDAITCKPEGTIGNIGAKGTANGTFHCPTSLAVILPEQNSSGKGSLYVAECAPNSRVQVFDLFTRRHELTIQSPKISTIAGSMNCWGIAVQTSTPTYADGAIYVADRVEGLGGCVRVFSAKDGEYKGHIEGTENQHVTGVSVCLDSEGKCQILVSSELQSRILVYRCTDNIKA